MFWHSSYGFYARSITLVAQKLSQILQIEWEAHDSEAWGDYYRYPPFQAAENRLPKESFKLYCNRVGLFYWKNPQFKNCRVLMNVTTDRPLEIDTRLFTEMDERVILLHRQVLDADSIPPKYRNHISG